MLIKNKLNIVEEYCFEKASIIISIISLIFCIVIPQVGFILSSIGAILSYLTIKREKIIPRKSLVINIGALIISSVCWIFYNPIINTIITKMS